MLCVSKSIVDENLTSKCKKSHFPLKNVNFSPFKRTYFFNSGGCAFDIFNALNFG